MTGKQVKRTIKTGKALRILKGLQYLAKRKTGKKSEGYDDMIYLAREILENYDNKEWWNNGWTTA